MNWWQAYGASVLACCLWALITSVVQGADNNQDAEYLQQLMTNLDVSADPCEDFYTYACGNWAQRHNSSAYVDVPGYMDHMVNEQLLGILRAHRNESGISQKLWQYQQSCEQLESPALNAFLQRVEPELNMRWPIFRSNWSAAWMNETQFDWVRTLAVLRTYGLNGVFITQNINVRLSNGSHWLLEIHQHQPRLRLNLEQVTSIFERFGMTATQAEVMADRVIDLEERMQNLTMFDFEIDMDDDEQKYEKSFEEITIADLMQNVSGIDWRMYFETLLERDVHVETEIVQMFALNIDYFEQLLSTLRGSTNETIAYYIMLKFMYQLNEDLPRGEDRSAECVKLLRGYMPLAMNYLYEKYRYQSQRSATDPVLHEIFNRLRKTFEHMIEENNLELESKQIAFVLDELKTMRMKVGNIPAKLTDQFVEDYYAQLSINSSDFYGNQLQLLKHLSRRQHSKLQNQPLTPEWDFFEHDPETSSSSSPVKIFTNAILVPYGYLQPPLFQSDLHPLFHYSLMGFILAHEIMHAYDLFHIVYDKQGNYNELGLGVAKHFWQSIHCFAQTPTDNLSENIADVTGMQLIYRTYFEDVATKHTQMDGLPLSGANLTGEQLFFINSVQFLCANMPRIARLHTDSTLNLEHDMHDVRVRQNWAHLEQFAAAFHCSNSSSMNPARKCRLW